MADKRLRRLLTTAAVAAFWLLLWQGVSMLTSGGLLLILIPTPLTVARTLCVLAAQPDFWRAAALSLLRVVTGFAIGAAAGIVLAVAADRWRLLHALIAPPLHVIRTAPVASFIILALAWVKTGHLPTLIAFLVVLPLIWEAVTAGIAATDPQLLELARLHRLSRARTLWHIRIPSVLPAFTGAAVNAIGFAWKSAVAAEVICRPADSLGRMLQQAKSYLEMPEVFAYTAVMILLSAALERLLRRAVRRIVTR